MTERVSSDPSRNVCRRPEDDEASQVAKDKPAPAPACRDRLVSAPPPDWDRVPNSCDENAAMAARNAASAGMCGGGPKGAPVSSRGTAPVKSEAPPPPPPAPSPAPAPKSAGASTNAARTSERDAGPYAAAGQTHDGKSVFAGAALSKGKLGHGFEEEKLSVSVQVGAQTEAQVTGQRLSYSSKHVSGSIEGGTANAHVGVQNSDGSVGINLGATATLLGGEVTVNDGRTSKTFGMSAGVGAEGHVGVRDADKDGQPEICFRVAADVVIVGGCVEIPIVIRP